MPKVVVSITETPENRLRQEVISALYMKGYPHHKTLEITTDQGIVTVQGTVPTYYLRQVAIECIKRVTGVAKVIDRIRVHWQWEDDNSPFLDTRHIQSDTEKGTLEVEATRTICNPVTKGLAATVMSSHYPLQDLCDEVSESPDLWFQRKIDLPAPKRLLNNPEIGSRIVRQAFQPFYTPQLNCYVAPCQLVWHEPRFEIRKLRNSH